MLLNAELCIVFSPRERETTARAPGLTRGTHSHENAVARVGNKRMFPCVFLT